jgi:hypothetical protein
MLALAWGSLPSDLSTAALANKGALRVIRGKILGPLYFSALSAPPW